MTDDDLRALERAVATDPSDEAAREKLDFARARADLGWQGETLPRKHWVEAGHAWIMPKLYGPGGTLPDGTPGVTERGVYELMVMPTESAGRGPGDRRWKPSFVGLELVYVPGGEAECERGMLASTPGHCTRTACHLCGGTGKREIAPFYLGRYPVTWRDWAKVWQTKGRGARRLAGTRRVVGDVEPVTNVRILDVRPFCSWAGLRLPSSTEWKWAALGGEAQRVVDRVGSLERTLVPRRYPWGNEPPSPERCVWAGHSEYGPSHLGRPHRQQQAAAAPVVEWTGCKDTHAPPHDVEQGCILGPARPAGASWCGAQDMAGNVGEMTEDLRVMGGSFRTPERSAPGEQPSLAEALQGRGAAFGESSAFDDVGFRVVLDAEGVQ